MKMMAESFYDNYFPQTTLPFTIMGMLLATKIKSGKEERHTDFE
jgi:hypothetical protein